MVVDVLDVGVIGLHWRLRVLAWGPSDNKNETTARGRKAPADHKSAARGEMAPARAASARPVDARF